MIQHIAETPEATASVFADFLLAQHAKKDQLSIALSGGSTPKLLFDILATDYQNLFEWKKLKLFWGDERCVPPDHADSNYLMTKEHLLSKVDIPESNIFRIRGEEDPAAEAIRYGQVMLNELEVVNGLPVFDIMMLGLGTDGHTASIFPHEMELLKETSTCAVATHPDSGQKRVSLSGPVINHSRFVCFLATGSSKKEKLTEIWNQSGNYLAYPASHIKNTHGSTHWFIDHAAAH